MAVRTDLIGSIKSVDELDVLIGDIEILLGDLKVTAGDIDLVHADKKLLLPLKNDATNPTLAFGDGDTGFYERADDFLAIAFGGIEYWVMNNGFFGFNAPNAPAILRVSSSATIPNLAPDYADTNTGIGHAAADALSLIAGGVEAHRMTEAAGAITHELIGTVQGDLLNNYMVQKAGFDVLGLMTDPRFLNMLCEDPGAGTMTDISGQGHDGTYQGSMTTSDRKKKNMGWVLDLDGVNDHITISDHNDLSFGDGSNDEAVTFFGVIEVVPSANAQYIFTKYDSTSGSELREYLIGLITDETLRLYQYDESANVGCGRVTNAALTAGYHSYVISSPGDGGATAMNNVKIYVDGALVASTASNDASYVAMENSSTECYIASIISSAGAADDHFIGDITCNGADGSEWSAYKVHRFHQLMKGLYGL